jgi:hypothetical protein
MLVGKHSEFWPDKYECPKCGGRAVGQHEEDLPRAFQTAAIIDLTAEELFTALNGLGLPDEEPASAETVKSLLLNEKITAVSARNISNTKRCTIDSITFSSGVRICLAASTYGAVVYRVIQPPAYAKRVLQEQA